MQIVLGLHRSLVAATVNSTLLGGSFFVRSAYEQNDGNTALAAAFYYVWCLRVVAPCRSANVDGVKWLFASDMVGHENSIRCLAACFCTSTSKRRIFLLHCLVSRVAHDFKSVGASGILD